MIAQLSGRLLLKDKSSCVLEVGGVGFELQMSASALAALPALDAPLTLLTYLQVSDDALTLYGFLSDAERHLFRELIGVSKVGSKLALGVLSAFPPDQLQAILAAADAKRLAEAPGIGKKTAERIVLELADKLASAENDAKTLASGTESVQSEAHRALAQMGFSETEIDLALRDQSGSVEQVLTAALQSLGGHL
ncbi:MAG: Holliday junction branch migration protein RuvA [Coriobacteriales bacterium]|jgi:Holliday junction DNA helicase RuvA|nr:Holliday junction branch migration protein RuvA [Coriobacteriales bacterium]